MRRNRNICVFSRGSLLKPGEKGILKAVVLWAALLVWTQGAARAQDELVSGEPRPGFFKGSLVEAIGPVVRDQLITEGPTRLRNVERRVIRFTAPDDSEVVAAHPEAFLGLPLGEVDENLRAYPQLKIFFRLK